jgi:protein O-GlcNAc transferase
LADILRDLYEEGVRAALREDWTVALARFQSVARDAPASLEVLNSLGVTCLAMRRPWRAAVYFRRVLRIEPGNATVLRHLGKSLWAADRRVEAVAAYEQAARLEPDLAAHRYSLAAALLAMGRAGEALPHARIGAALDPRDPDAASLLADCLAKNGQIREAEKEYRRALKLAPDRGDNWNNLAAVESEQGRIAAAVKHFVRAVELTGSAAVHSNLLLVLHYGGFSAETIFREHRNWAVRHYSRSLVPPAHSISRPADRRLRVGYVSADFRDHSVAFLIEPVLANHDRDAVEVFLYPTVPLEDAITGRLRSYGGHWHPIARLNDADAATLVASHRLDVLVDLSGHSAGNRLGVFALRPAPVQATYCGYPDTTGLPAIDYRITDEWCDPPGKTEHLHTERLWRLPPGFLCFRPPEYAPDVSPLPAAQSGRVTFGCFAIRQKITGEALHLWAEILRCVPDSRLILKSRQVADPAIAPRITSRMETLGIDPGHLEFRGNTAREDHIRHHADVDLMLDTMPYCGTVASCEALWMGVPVLTLAGSSHVARVGCSLMTRVGLPDWVANSRPMYVRKGVAFASDLANLAETRKTLRGRFASSSLGDPVAVTRALEEAYRGMAGMARRRKRARV